MNKGISLLILGVLVCAMGLVFYSHMQNTEQPVTNLADSSPSVNLPDGASDTASVAPTLNTGTLMPPAGNAPASSAVELPRKNQQIAGQNAAVQGQSASQNGQTTTLAANQSGGQEEEQPKINVSPLESQPKLPEGQKNTEVVKPLQQVTANAGSAEPEKKAPAQPQKKPDEPTQVAKQETTEPQKTAENEATPAKKDGNTQSFDNQKAQATAKTELTPVKDIPADGKHAITHMGLHFSGKQIYLKVDADTPFPFKTFALPGPERFVLDLPGTWAPIHPANVPSNQLVTKIRVGQQKNGPRVVLDLTRATKYEVKRISDNSLEIYFE